MMPKALDLYKQSDVYKQTIMRRLQRKEKADETRTSESAVKIAAKAREVVDNEAKMQELESKQGSLDNTQDELVSTTGTASSPADIPGQARLV